MPARHWRMCSAAIARQRRPSEPEIVAIDSGSTDGTLDCFGAHGATRPQRPAARRSTTGARATTALKHAAASSRCCSCRMPCPRRPTWLAALVEPLGRRCLARRHVCAPTDRPRGASRVTTHYLGAVGRGAIRTEHRRSARGADVRADVTIRSGTPSAPSTTSVRASGRASGAVHPFPATPIAEDLEWARDVLLAGHRLAYVPEAVVEHSHDRSVTLRAAADLPRSPAAAGNLRLVYGANISAR